MKKIILLIVLILLCIVIFKPLEFSTMSDYVANIESENYHISDDTVGYVTATKELPTNDAVMLSEIGEYNYITLYVDEEIVYNFSIEENELYIDSMTINNESICPSKEECKEEYGFEIWFYTKRAEKLVKDIT